MTTTIKQRLAEGKLVQVMTMGALASPKLVEMVGLLGALDGIWFDQEHSAIPHQQLELLMLACRAAGLDAFVRVAPTDYTAIMRPMETGASGVMAAQIRTVDQVRQIVAWAKYPPIGVRGLFQSNYEAGYTTRNVPELIEEANRNRWLVIQIETPEAVECAHEIAAVEHVDWLFVGPADLACTLGVPGELLHPKCIAALGRVAAAAKAAGKPWGALVRGAEHAAKCRELGCQLFSLMSDVDLFLRGIQSTRSTFAALLDGIK